MKMKNRIDKFITVLFFIILNIVSKSETMIPIPKIDIGVGVASGPEEVVTSLQILMLLTVLTLAPAIIMMTTSFIRTIIVLHFVRQAIGVQQLPPNQILIGLALFLTFFIMQPTINQMMETGVTPYLDKKISQEEMFRNVEIPLKTFMLKQTKIKDLELFLKISKVKPPKNRREIPLSVVLPAFVVSELTRGFQVGIILFIPFIIIDMIVATVLMSLGMMMLPPAMISLPFKLLLFVMVDGWSLIIESLVLSFQT
ncbi:MAG: flagellar type III secretion system pore protein FliP [Fusobacteria bacterium]|nr:flagellar type III secretion system pore protein FliP [Fusobacteriota bacterium]